ncbi:transcriptional repressor [Rhodovulum sp. 12E13]|uniref:Fur family transcriptional regulator n=1 Tax=Rhodovulum sp. 12E13 TaxID=2203891 RepID=UPI000E1841DD|nr:Fur family transcriptional regulator [Rhodovulum sp. 12E13]RDC73131.1 transcriptional repressor [Rhodovulum sp. 12E13]
MSDSPSSDPSDSASADRTAPDPDSAGTHTSNGGGAVGFDRHDHARCIATALAAAERHCAQSGLRLTPARRRVLEILLEQHRAMGAYEVLDRMQKEGLGSQPPAAYRALDFLVSNGFAHRIEGRNAFVACVHPGERHLPAFLHCRSCGAVAETRGDLYGSLLARAAEETGFGIEETVVEAKGLCPTCLSDGGLSGQSTPGKGEPGAI